MNNLKQNLKEAVCAILLLATGGGLLGLAISSVYTLANYFINNHIHKMISMPLTLASVGAWIAVFGTFLWVADRLLESEKQ